MEFKQLKIFMAIWDHQNITKAANEVYLTQPTVSSHLKSLEEELGVKLFNRSSKEISPTQAAKLIYPYVKEILRLNKQIFDEINEFLGVEKGILEIGASNIPGQYLLPHFLSKFKKMRPNIEIKLSISDSAEILEEVLSNRAEIGLIGAKFNEEQLIFEEVFDDELILIASSSHPFASKSVISLKELLKEPLIIREYGSGTRITLEKKLLEYGISIKDLKIVLEAGSTEAVRQAVKVGLGCGIISKRAAKDDLKCGHLISPKIKDFQIKRKFFLIYHKNRTISPVASTFINFLKKEAFKEAKSP